MASFRLTKLDNGNVEVNDTSLLTPKPYTLQPSYDVKPVSNVINIVDGSNGVVDTFSTSQVFEVVSDGGTVSITDNDAGLSTLINQLQTYFFFKASTTGGSGGVDSINGETGTVNLTSDDIPDNSVIDSLNITQALNFLADGGKENFAVFSLEGISTLNNGQFFSCALFIEGGVFNTVRVYTRNLNLSPTQSFQLRTSIHQGLNTIKAQGVIELTDTNNNIHDIPLSSDIVLSSNYYYLSVGVNDNVGGGSIDGLRTNANGLNSPELAFTFSNPTGVIPSDLTPLSRPSTNTVFYELIYKS